MIGHIGALMPFLASPTLCEQIYHDRQDHIMAGSGQPVGTADRVPGGRKGTGSWPFASGCQNAEWIGGTCVMMESGSPIDASDGPGPMIRTCFMPAEYWEIRDTWHTFGLKGTGSHDVALTDVFVPDENFLEFPCCRSSSRTDERQVLSVRPARRRLHGGERRCERHDDQGLPGARDARHTGS